MFSYTKCAFAGAMVVLTGGLFLILLTWRSDIKLNCVYERVQLKNATKVLLKARISSANATWWTQHHWRFTFRISSNKYSRKT